MRMHPIWTASGHTRRAAAPCNRRRPLASRGGLTLLETVVSLSILVVSLLAFTRVVIASMQAARTEREVTLARQAARQVLEQMQGEPLAQVFARYNASNLDDPGGVGTAPGNRFAVPGLQPRLDSPDGMVGEIVFPIVDVAGVAQLREDVVDAGLGMPRDLNGDGLVDSVDRSADYELLPVLVRISWRGRNGPAQVELKTLLASF